jgi:hypothetical protein
MIECLFIECIAAMQFSYLRKCDGGKSLPIIRINKSSRVKWLGHAYKRRKVSALLKTKGRGGGREAGGEKKEQIRQENCDLLGSRIEAGKPRSGLRYPRDVENVKVVNVSYRVEACVGVHTCAGAQVLGRRRWAAVKGPGAGREGEGEERRRACSGGRSVAIRIGC